MGWGNNRAVSEVLGAILLFGIVVLALGSYQAFVVPQQNAEIESNHDAQVSNEFAEIQPAISNAAASGRTRTTSVTLGTRYPVRAAALNPPTVTGQLSTGPSGDVVVENDGSPVDACALDDSREDNTVLRYKANYNELGGTGALVYENGITYRETDGNGPLIKNSQELIDGNTITLFPLVSEEFSTASSGSKQLRFEPNKTGTRIIDVDAGSDLTISFPSRLNDTDWEEILDDADVTENGDRVTITLTPSDNTQYTVQCTPVGLESKPGQEGVPQDDASPDEDEDAPNEINPAGEGSVAFNSISHAGEENKAVVEFENLDSTSRTIVEARIPFYTSAEQSAASGEVAKYIEFETGDSSERIGGPYVNIDDVEIAPDDTGVVTVNFYCDEATNDEFTLDDREYFLMSLKFESGEVSNYFIRPDRSANNLNNRC
jgi:hypothetical protein